MAPNDRFGHATGDDAIVEAARAMGSSVRDGDVVARMGGDEFVVSAIVESDRDVEHLVGRLLAAVHQAAVATPEGPTPLRCSVGVAVTDGPEPGETVLGRADAALYEAKRAGRGRAAWADDATRRWQPDAARCQS